MFCGYNNCKAVSEVHNSMFEYCACCCRIYCAVVFLLQEFLRQGSLWIKSTFSMLCFSYFNPLITHSLTAALDQLRVVAFSTSNNPGLPTRQHQQIGQCLLPLVAANFFVDDPWALPVRGGRSASVGFY